MKQSTAKIRKFLCSSGDPLLIHYSALSRRTNGGLSPDILESRKQARTTWPAALVLYPNERRKASAPATARACTSAARPPRTCFFTTSNAGCEARSRTAAIAFSRICSLLARASINRCWTRSRSYASLLHHIMLLPAQQIRLQLPDQRRK